ncbi:MAG: restriction endonuclease subunit S [Epsilonproteobacteria bacterium]|nr:MAG: restriction endonuclease subunit S [Campylobacterota bacterium]
MSKLLNLIRFTNLNKWSVHLLTDNNLVFTDKYPTVYFKEFTKKGNIEKVKIEDNKTYKILGVRTYGLGVFLNREVLGSTLTMKTYQQVKKDHLFWCKVDTKNGGFGIVSDTLKDGLGSSNMAIAELDLSKINTDYLQLFFKSKRFNSYMDNLVVGTTNRKYIKFNDLLNDIKIPLPSLDIQNKIVKGYHDKLDLSVSQEQQAQEKEKKIEEYLYKELGIEISDINNTNLLNFVKFRNIERWDIQANSFNLNDIKSSYEFIKIKKLIKKSQYGLSEKANLNSNNTPMLRMNNIKNGQLDINDLKYIDLNNKKLENYILNKNDIVFNRTNSKELVGKCAVFNLFDTYTFASYLIRLKLDLELINPNYFAIILNSFIGRKQINAISRQITGQVNVNAEELKNFVIPFPNLNIQNMIVDYIQNINDEIKELKNQSLKNKTSALIEFEKEIFNEA